MKNLTTLNLSHNKFRAIDFAFIALPLKLSLLDISNNQLNGHFGLNVTAKSLRTLSIANNNYTSIQQNMKKLTPNLRSIDFSGNYFDCAELTANILFLNYDHIKVITPIETPPIGEENVKGMRCHRAGVNGELVSDRSSRDSVKTSYNMLEVMMNKTLDDKLTRLENRLIDLFNNVTQSQHD